MQTNMIQSKWSNYGILILLYHKYQFYYLWFEFIKKKKRDSNIEKQTITTGLLSKSNKIIRNSDIQNKKHLLHKEALRKCDFSWRINLHISLPSMQ